MSNIKSIIQSKAQPWEQAKVEEAVKQTELLIQNLTLDNLIELGKLSARKGVNDKLQSKMGMIKTFL